MSLRRRRVGLLCAVALACAPTPAQAEGSDCIGPVRERAGKIGVDLKDIRGMRFYERVSGGIVIGYDAWVKFHSCTGNLVVVSRACQYQQSFWRGDCPSDGMVKEEQ